MEREKRASRLEGEEKDKGKKAIESLLSQGAITKEQAETALKGLEK